MRRLRITHRIVPLDRVDEYQAAWQDVRTAAEAEGGRAWLYRGSDHQDHYIEFLEWKGEDLPPLPDRAPVSAMRDRLAESFAARTDNDWEAAE